MSITNFFLRPPAGRKLCVSGVSLQANAKAAENPVFDVVIIYRGGAVRSAYPVVNGSCKEEDFHKCSYKAPTSYPENRLHDADKVCDDAKHCEDYNRNVLPPHPIINNPVKKS